MDIQQAENSSQSPAPSSDAVQKRRLFSMRGFASLLLALSMLVMGFAGFMLYLTPRGRVANWTDWSLVGLGKEQWASLHMNASLLFAAVAVLHLILNWSMFLGYLKKKAVAGFHMKKELTLATAIALTCVIGTISNLPPFGSVAALNHEIKDYWEMRAAQAPVPHAEELTLVEFAGQIDLPVDDLTEALREEGFNAADIHLTVGEIGRQNGVAPSAVLAAVQKHHPEAGAMSGRGPGQGRGQGFGQGRGMQSLQSESGCSKDPQSADACSESTEGCDSGADSERSSEPAEGHGPGFGSGGGQGFGQGQGMGMGRGRGMGLGQGGDGEPGRPGADD